MIKSIALAATASIVLAGAANAGVIFAAGSIVPLKNVHSDGTQGPLATVLGTLVTDGDVTFASGASNLNTNGNGVAQIDGPWSSITYGMTDHTGILVTDFSVDQSGQCHKCTLSLDALLVGGGHVTGSLDYPGHDTKFYAQATGGDTIDRLTITVLDSSGGLHTVDSLRQVKIGLAGGVPEPATWATMILGMGVLGLAMRRRRESALSA